MIRRDGHYEIMYAERPYDSGFREVEIETQPKAYEWEEIPMFAGPLWYGTFSRPSKTCIRETQDDGFTMTTKLFNNTHIAQAAFNIDGTEYVPRHNKLKCDVDAATRDFTGYMLKFTLSTTANTYRPADLPYGTSASFVDSTGKEWYIRLYLWADPASRTGEYMEVTIDFDKLHTGFSDWDAFREKVPVTDLKLMSINAVDVDFHSVGGYDDGKLPIPDLPEKQILEPKLGDVVVSNIRCYRKSDGKPKTIKRGRPQQKDGKPYQTDLGIATSFDDIANISPQRVVEDMYKLGYRNVINHYLGISNYPKLKWMTDTKQFQLDPDVCFDDVARLWHEDFFRRCIAYNFTCIVAVSMEVFYDYVKYNWRPWMQLCQGFQVLDIDDEYIRIEGKHPWSSTANPFLGGWEHQGLFNPNKEWAADIRFAHPQHGGRETVYKVLEVTDVPNEDKTMLKLDKIFRGAYGDYSVGKPALTGYNPPSTFFGTCIEDPRGDSYVARMFKELADCLPPDMPKMFQVGEPWYWDGSYQNGRLFVYDAATKKAALADGVEIPVWKDITSFTKQRASQQEIAAANWLRDALGRYTQEAKVLTQKAYPDAEFSALTFIPQIFTTKSEITPIINFPVDHWKFPNFEFFQYEAYDTIMWNDLEFTNAYCDYAFNKLGYPVEKTNYLGGFAPNKDPLGRVWKSIAHQLSWPNTKLDESRRPMASLIWSSTQVNRDSVMFKDDGGALPLDKKLWTQVLEPVSDWTETSRQDKYWLPSIYGVSEGTVFTQHKLATEQRLDQWFLVNPEDPTDRIPHGGPITSRRTVTLATQTAIGLKGSRDYYPFADCILDKPISKAVFDYDKDELSDLITSSIDWGDGSQISEGLEPDVGDYADSGPEVNEEYGPTPMNVLFAGQSQAAVHFLYGDEPDRGVDEYERKMTELMDVSPEKMRSFNGATGSSAADRASAVNPKSDIFDPEQTSGSGGLWWWDLERDVPGPCLTHCMKQAGDVEMQAVIWSQGDQDAVAIAFPDQRVPKPSIERTQRATKRVFDFFRQRYGDQLQVFIQEQGWAWTEEAVSIPTGYPVYMVPIVSSWGDIRFNWLSYNQRPSGLTYAVEIMSDDERRVLRTIIAPGTDVDRGLIFADYPVEMSIPDFGFPPTYLKWRVRVVETGLVSHINVQIAQLNNSWFVRKIIMFGGQSNAFGHFSELSGDRGRKDKTSAGTFRRDMAARLGMRDVQIMPVNVSLGSSAADKKAAEGGGDNYWWDLDGNKPGPRMVDLLATMKKVGARPTELIWSQGEADVSASQVPELETSPARFKATTEAIYAHIRKELKVPDLPVWVQMSTRSYWGDRDPLGNEYWWLREVHIAISKQDPYTRIGSWVVGAESINGYSPEVGNVGRIHYTSEVYHRAARDLSQAISTMTDRIEEKPAWMKLTPIRNATADREYPSRDIIYSWDVPGGAAATTEMRNMSVATAETFDLVRISGGTYRFTEARQKEVYGYPTTYAFFTLTPRLANGQLGPATQILRQVTDPPTNVPGPTLIEQQVAALQNLPSKPIVEPPVWTFTNDPSYLDAGGRYMFPFDPSTLKVAAQTDFPQPVAYGEKMMVRDMQARLITDNPWVHMGALTKQYSWMDYRQEPGLGYIHFSQETAQRIGAALAESFLGWYGKLPTYMVTMDANYHTYYAPGVFQPKVQPYEAAKYTSIWFRDGGVQDVDFGMFPIAITLNFSHNDMTTVQMDTLIDKLMAFSEERAREAYRQEEDLHLYLSQQSTGERATQEKAKELVRYFDNLGVRMVVHT